MAAAAPASAPEKATPATSLSLAAVHHQPGQQTGRDAGETADAAEAHADAGRRLPTVTVMRLDSLWSIAERVLGDGDRWPEIAALNEGRTMSDGTKFISADRIKPGWELRVPPGAQVDQDHPVVEHEVVEHQVVVEEGDTLSQIALEELGDADAYPQIFEASKDIAQPGGRHLVDPDVIDVGWTVEIPGQDAPVDHEPEPSPDTVLRRRRTAHRPAARRSHGADGGHPDVTGDRSPEHSGRTSGRRRSAGHLRHGRPGRTERGHRRRNHRIAVSAGYCGVPFGGRLGAGGC